MTSALALFINPQNKKAMAVFKGPMKIGKYVVVESNAKVDNLVLGDVHNHYQNDHSSHPTQVNIKPAECPQEIERSSNMPLPTELATEKAMKYWSRMQEAKMVDAHYQPTCTVNEAAILAYRFADVLGIHTKWKTFGAFWSKKNMAIDYQAGINQKKSINFIDRMNTEVFYD